MTFVSLSFFIFVAVLVLLYYLVPKKLQWILLLAASYVFYWINSKWLVLLLFVTTAITYLTGLGIQKINDRSLAYLQAHEGALSREEKKNLKAQTKKAARRIMLLGVILVLCILLFLKYFNFFGANINSLFSLLNIGGQVPQLNLLVPMGISFYTLQAVSYIVDIYRGKVQADRNLAKFMLFMSFFPQIIQGPIARHNQLAHQLYESHKFDYQRLCFGAQLALWGIIKKLIISERLITPVNYIFDHFYEYTGPIVFLSVLLYGVQIYTDFSGGIDIARGVAQMLGIDLEENFKQPFFSTSIEDFWRRWHITMGSWMRDYVFYPLSLSKAFTNLSRKSRKLLGTFVGKRLPAFLSMFVVYFLVGFWHGPNWKYVFFGLYNGIFIMTSIILEGVYQKLRTVFHIEETAVTWRIFRVLRTIVIVSYGRFFTRADTWKRAVVMMLNTFENWKDISFLYNYELLSLGLDTANWLLVFAFIVLLFYVDYMHEKGVSFRVVFARQPLLFRWVIYIGAVLSVLIFGMYGPEYVAADFIYQQF